jgi:hypothetical protein
MKKKTPLPWTKIMLQGSGVLFCLFVMYIYFSTSLFTIDTYIIVGAPREKQQELESVIRSYELERIGYILPGNSIFSYHRKAIRRDVYEVLPNTREVTISTSGLHSVVITVIPQVPVFRMHEGKGVTKDGVVYEEIQDVYDLPLLVVATSSLVTEEDIKTAGVLYPKIEATLFKVKTVYIDQEHDIHIKGGVSMSEVIVSGDASPENVWSTIVSAIDTNPLKDKLADSIDRLQYLDARFGNKVFYKFTNGETSSIIEHTYATSSERASTSSNH